LNQKAVLIPSAQSARWHEIASATPGLTKTEVAVLSAVAEYYRVLDQRGYARPPSIEQMALSSGARPVDITTAVKRLVSLALLGVKPGSGRWRNEYLIALPKRLATSLMAAEDAPPL
jgi:hypothetical protein